MSGRSGSERSRAALFLMEQIIVIAVFAVCAAVCVKIFSASFLMANDTRDTYRALAAAKSAAECYKACGDPVEAAAVLRGRAQNGRAQNGRAADETEGVVYYDADWRVCSLAEAAYALRLEALRLDASRFEAGEAGGASPLLCGLSVEKITGEKITGFTVAAKRAAGTRKPPPRGAGDE